MVFWRLIMLGAPVLLVILLIDFWTLPNGDGRYSGAAAWRDRVLLARDSDVRSGAHTATLGSAWPVWYVEAWKDDSGWHAWTEGDEGGSRSGAAGARARGWAQGGSVMVFLNQPGLRVGFWAAGSEVQPKLSAFDAASSVVNPRSLPKEGVDAIRAAFVRAGGEAAGRVFDTSPVWLPAAGAFGDRTLTPQGLLHNLLALALGIAGLVCAALWVPAQRQCRRLTRGLCLRCGYALRGVTLEQCPECGRRFTRTGTYPRG